MDKSQFASADLPFLGVAIPAAILREAGAQAELIDCTGPDWDVPRLRSALRQTRGVTMVGIPAIYGSMFNVYAIAYVAKEELGVPVVVGGLPATFSYETLLRRCSAIDICAMGEADYTLLDLVNAERWGDVLGIAFRREGRVVVTPPRPVVQDLEALPYPAYDLFPITLYNSFYTVETQRGCPFYCGFCVQSPKEGKRVRRQSVPKVIETLRRLKADVPEARRIMFVDNDFLLDVDRGIEILEAMITAGLSDHFQIMFASRIRHFRSREEKLFELIEAMNIIVAYFGVESLSSKNIEELDKISDPLVLREFFSRLEDAGVMVVPSYIIGFPNETEQDMRETIALAKRNNTLICKVNLYTPYPGTAPYTDLEAEGKILDVPLHYWDNTHPVFEHPADLAAMRREFILDYYEDFCTRYDNRCFGPHAAEAQRYYLEEVADEERRFAYVAREIDPEDPQFLVYRGGSQLQFESFTRQG